jgi:hypothetical protein
MSRAKPRFRIEVDGELFEVLAGQTGSDEYEWISGPNQGYGFGSSRSDRTPSTMEDHEEAIRNFLSMVDRETGFIE